MKQKTYEWVCNQVKIRWLQIGYDLEEETKDYLLFRVMDEFILLPKRYKEHTVIYYIKNRKIVDRRLIKIKKSYRLVVAILKTQYERQTEKILREDDETKTYF